MIKKFSNQRSTHHDFHIIHSAASIFHPAYSVFGKAPCRYS